MANVFDTLKSFIESSFEFNQENKVGFPTPSPEESAKQDYQTFTNEMETNFPSKDLKVPSAKLDPKKLLDLIGSKEASVHGYNQLFGASKKADLTSKTIDEILDFQKTLKGSQVVGRYQFKPETLKELKNKLKLTGKEYFDEGIQDMLGMALLEKRKLSDYLTGKISKEQFGNLLSQEWASFPLLSDNPERKLKRGQSFYDKVGSNVARATPEEVEEILSGSSKN
jgi:muramidase (phage lysozyme)